MEKFFDLSQEVKLRRPCVEDGKAIWNLVKGTGVLDLNSAYSYLMLCKYFHDTCVVAEINQEIVGFISAFIPPTNPDTIFVWQVGVEEAQRGKGVGLIMLKDILAREVCKEVRFLDITVTLSNIPAQALYRKLARELGVTYEVSECFSRELFPDVGHEAELMFHIGPFF